jgi:DNA-binding NtrC family response regulator
MPSVHDLRTPNTDMVVLPERRGPLHLLVESGNGRRLRLADRPIFIGSHPELNDVVIYDATVSARHARLDPSDGGYVLRDLSSRNGTWVEGLSVQVARVTSGSRIRLGRTNLLIVADDGVEGRALVAESEAMKRLLAEAQTYARLSWPALVVGPSGAGKEGIARALHDEGPRRDGAFVAINAGGLPRHLVESELFGHEKGAFTGADAARRGVFEQASGGTLFLDEIGELPRDLQSRLLRVLETGEVRRVGGEGVISVDVRVVAATHRDLGEMVQDGDFREDLYYRLARLVLEVPGLAERPRDIPALARRFLEDIHTEVGPRRLSSPAIDVLLGHQWRGNVRELKNVVTAAAVATAGEVVQAADVEAALRRISRTTDPIDIEALEEVVARHKGNLAAAARALGLPRSTLRDRIKGPQVARPRPRIVRSEVA